MQQGFSVSTTIQAAIPLPRKKMMRLHQTFRMRSGFSGSLCMTLSSLADLSFFPTGNRGVARIGGILPPVQQRSLRRSESKKYMAAQSPQGLSAAIFFYGSDWKWACPVMPYFFKYSSCSPSRRKSRGRFR